MTAPGPRLVVLTPQQRAVLGELTRDGATNDVIAARLTLSEHTVKSHMKAIVKAFGYSGGGSRTAVVIDCLRGRVAVRVVNNSGGHLRRNEEAA